MSDTIEQEARRLRDNIYGEITNEEWDKIKHQWIEDIQWLLDNQPEHKN